MFLKVKLFIFLKIGPLNWTATPFYFNFKTKRYLLNTSYVLGFVFAFVLNDYHCPDQPIFRDLEIPSGYDGIWSCSLSHMMVVQPTAMSSYFNFHWNFNLLGMYGNWCELVSLMLYCLSKGICSPSKHWAFDFGIGPKLRVRLFYPFSRSPSSDDWLYIVRP